MLELDEIYQLIRLYFDGRTIREFMIRREEDQSLFQKSPTRNLDGRRSGKTSGEQGGDTE